MTEHMLTLAKDPDLASKMGKAARKRIEEYFSLELSIARLREIIKSCTQK
jgi:glycosyltransferase involved in cell wall biosynthesis